MSGFLQGIRRYERRRRLWRLVEVRGPDECWPWLGEVDAGGQPIYRGRPARDLVYAQARRGREPDGPLEAACGHDTCVNPEHARVPGGAGPVEREAAAMDRRREPPR